MFESITHLVFSYSYVGVFALIFIESGIIIGAFMPGDSLLFLSGIVAAKGVFMIYILIPTIVSAAFIGNEFGYWAGRKYGWLAISAISKKYAAPQYHKKAHDFYTRWGAWAIVVARFVPVMRSLVPTVAGMAEMKHSSFTLANALGACIWGISLPLLGYILGEHVPNHMLSTIGLIGVLGVVACLFLFKRWVHTD